MRKTESREHLVIESFLTAHSHVLRIPSSTISNCAVPAASLVQEEGGVLGATIGSFVGAAVGETVGDNETWIHE